MKYPFSEEEMWRKLVNDTKPPVPNVVAIITTKPMEDEEVYQQPKKYIGSGEDAYVYST